MTTPSTPSLRICFVRAYVSAKPNAITQSMTELALRLRELGHDPYFLSIRPVESVTTATIRERSPSKLAGPGGSRRSRLMRQLWFLLTAARWLIKHEDEYDVVVTVDTPPGIGVLGWLARRRNPSKMHIAWVLDLFYSQAALLESKPSVGLRVLRALEIRSLAVAQHVVVLGDCMKAFVRRAIGHDSVSVIPIWAGADLLGASGRSPASEDRQLIYSGHAAARHPLLWISDVDWPAHGYTVRIQGDGTEIDALRQLLTQCKTQRGVTVGGPLSRGEYLVESRRATVHLVSLDSRASGTCVPSKTYAAMALGRPVLFVGDDRGQAALDVAESGGGLVLRNPVEDFSRLMRFLSLPREELDRMGASGQEFVRAERTVERAADAWAALMLDALSKMRDSAMRQRS